MEFVYLLAEGGDLIDPTHPTSLSLKTGLWALGIFVVVLFVLRKFAWGPIVEGLNSRENRIAASLDKAEAIEKATRELAETNRKTLEDAQKQAQSIIAEARESGKHAAAEIVGKAQAEIDSQRDRAKRELQLEVQKAQADLRQNAAELTLMATSQLLGRALSGDAEEQQRLVDEALRDAESVARG